MQIKHLNVINIEQAEIQIKAAFRANINLALVGAPGCGKTSICGPIAESTGRVLIPILGSAIDSVEIGGLPVIDNDARFRRAVMEGLRRATEVPALILWDEASCWDQATRAAALDVLFSKRVGDGIPLHPLTRQIACWNPPDQAPNASEPEASVVNRFAVFHLVPELEEVTGHFLYTLGEVDDDIAAPWFRDWAATAAHVSGLVQFDPPAASINDGAPWGSPRAWEYGLRLAAAVEAEGSSNLARDTLYALSSCVGKQQAQNYLAVRKLREIFPTPTEMAKDPEGCSLPADPDKQIGILGLLQEVARLDVWAAWILAARCREEIGQAAGRGIGPRGSAMRQSPHARPGSKARDSIMKKVGRRMLRRVGR